MSKRIPLSAQEKLEREQRALDALDAKRLRLKNKMNAIKVVEEKKARLAKEKLTRAWQAEVISKLMPFYGKLDANEILQRVSAGASMPEHVAEFLQ